MIYHLPLYDHGAPALGAHPSVFTALCGYYIAAGGCLTTSVLQHVTCMACLRSEMDAVLNRLLHVSAMEAVDKKVKLLGQV